MLETGDDIPLFQSLEAAARTLAHSHSVGQAPAQQLSVYRHLAQMPDWLARVARYCKDPKPEHTLVADWLLDNDYQVLRTVRQLREDLPEKFYRRLPALDVSEGEAPPRIFAVAHAALQVMQKQLAINGLERYINAYQESAPLKIAELWALPSMLRLASLEILAGAFQELVPDLAPPWRISRYASLAGTVDVTDRVALAITGLAAVHTLEWSDFFDHTSCVERVLRSDPAGSYAGMDFQSRDRYRHSVERLATDSPYSEVEIAHKAVACAGTQPPDSRESHVGFWLVGRGIETLEQDVGYQRPWRERLQKALLDKAGLCYSLAAITLFLVALGLPLWYLLATGAGLLACALGLLLLLVPASVISLGLSHWLITSLVSVRFLSAMDYRKGIPSDCKTAVLVPVIISSAQEIPGLVERLELRRLANPDPMLHFVLLSDLRDAAEETLAADKVIEDALVAAIANLNRESGWGRLTGGRGNFYLLHRQRHFNPAQNCWMGRERKRGKIEAFNQFILSGELGEFVLSEGDLSRLEGTEYVITLDADTMLPPGAAASLVGTISHPLNKPEWDSELGKVVSGYSVIQPRLEVLPLSGPVSLFCRLFAGDTAIDIYSRAVSDLYQDLFGSGTFVGKGIYHLSTFQRSLENRVPENAILSHDLFEGAHARTALASNIILYENFPDNYPEYALRLHRWIRGDWQLLPWLAKAVPAAGGAAMPNILSPLDRWKIVDNLRRSLVMPALLLLLFCGWTLLPGSPWLWTLFAVLAPGVYLSANVFNAITRSHRRVRFADMRYRMFESSGRWFLSLAFLISESATSIDAIARTLWRLFVSRRDLLQWRPAAHVQASLSRGSLRRTTWRLMWPSPACAVLLTPLLALYYPAALLPAAPLLLLWLIAPEISIWLSHPRVARRQHLRAEERDFLLRIARRTWHFFEAFAGPGDNWLPPDNFQADPKAEIAHRTSPTNIGMLLTSAVMAHDQGFICTDDFVARIRNALDSMERLRTYRGHLLNWYDTRTLAPLEPRYVSTVDSGNLAMCLVALRQSCLDYASGPVCLQELWRGLECTFSLLLDAVQDIAGLDRQLLEKYEARFQRVFPQDRWSAGQWRNAVVTLVGELWPEFEQVLVEAMVDATESTQSGLMEVRVWLGRFHHDLHALERQLDDYLPWLEVLNAPPTGCEELASSLIKELSPTLGLQQIGKVVSSCQPLVDARKRSRVKGDKTTPWLERLDSAFSDGIARQESLRRELRGLAARVDTMTYRMDFSLLYDAQVRLFRIGYNVSTGQDDHSHYDLLASEARMASYFAIAKRDVPMEHWFSLGRPIARLRGKPVVLSWTGSMFEYLMPALFMPGYRDTLLGESESIAVMHQRDYAVGRKIPWGISESAFAVTDADDNYQYKAFGAPGLGLRRGLGEDLVVAPYASALALGLWPRLAVANLKKLAQLAGVGVYGFMDALDFTHKRSPQDLPYRPVKTYMAHHQGMIAAAIANTLNDNIFVRRVMADKRLGAFEMLLQERVPWEIHAEEGRVKEMEQKAKSLRPIASLSGWLPSTMSVVPQMQLIGNGRMASWQSEAGGGGLYWRNLALTRWLPDASGNCHGYWLYIRDVESQALWSATRLPVGSPGIDAKTVFHQHMVEHFSRHHDIALRTEMTVAPDDDINIRRITLANEGATQRTIELTSYAEVVLAPPLEDERHPAFSKLFVGSEFCADYNGLLFTRRPRRPDAQVVQLLHMAVLKSPGLELVGYETDRGAFIGRGGNSRQPQGLKAGLSRTTGWTLDPVMALTVRATLEPNETASLSLLTIAAGSTDELWRIANRYQTASLDWAFRDAARMAARQVARLGLAPAVLPEMQVLASLLLQPHPKLRQAPTHLGVSRYGQEDLWHFGISGDLPILLLRIAAERPTSLLETLIRAQHLWRSAGLNMDIVVLRTGFAGYEDPLRETVLAVLRDAEAFGYLGQTGGVHLLFADHMTARAQRGIESVAHVVLDDDTIPLSLKLDTIVGHRALPPPLEATGAEIGAEVPAQPALALDFDNGLGGFEPASGDFVVELGEGEHTPAPWCNILANDQFGAVVSESGLGFSWAANSGENRLSPSSSDPVEDPPGEVLYLRDEVAAHVWSVTPAPLGESAPCRIRHGAGFTCWQKQNHGLDQELLVFVPPEDPVKLARLRLKNLTTQPRRITATYYAQWLLGAPASNLRSHIVCEYDPAQQAIVAHNPWRSEFSERIAFLSATHAPHSVSGDRYEFLGHEGALDNPAGLRQSDLGGGFNFSGDPCAAYQVHLNLAPGETVETVFIFGQGANEAETSTLITRYRKPGQCDATFAQLQAFWQEQLGSIRVATPDPAFDTMVNRWLIYQTLASRMMARAGFYQASGAYGYRDQLQDCLALLAIDPQRVRNHILRAARHQFAEGDAQHWWHPPTGRGVRTRCSDDYIWLAYVTARYVHASADTAILDSPAPFLLAPPLGPDEEDRYARFDRGRPASLFEHCCRALDHMMGTGEHGLPLIGSGDWNDGMDRVGAQGRGESVWLAWFQIAAIKEFTPLAVRRGAAARAERWQEYAAKLKVAIDEFGWDGEWFIRALDDSGEPWGSRDSDECKIDSISQSWGVLAGFGQEPRVRTAMKAAREKLLHEEERLILLLDPPFHLSARDPGYIQAYPPGIRENGGQYTHAASWMGLAFAGLGDGDTAWQIFDILNPIRRNLDQIDVQRYRREPYVMAADVYSQGANRGHGGWSWYTGAASWTWQLAVEGILGLRLVRAGFQIDPCLPRPWGRAELTIRREQGCIHFVIEDPDHVGRGVRAITVDGESVAGEVLQFPGQDKEMRVTVRLGKTAN
jgi:cyclic beta-1,2-glucan synthetase